MHFLPLVLLLAGCGRLDELLLEPATTPAQWCAQRPCIAVRGMVVGAPLGIVLVFLLAVLWIAGGVHFLWTPRGQRSRIWLGIALVLGGVGAAQAGISYQAFGYTLKCAGRVHCLLTNGFEVGYSVTQALSVSAMLTAVAYACATGAWRKRLIGCAALNAAAYLAVTTAGIMLASRVLLSFEVLLLFALPGTTLVILVAGCRYRRFRSPMDRTLVIASLLLVLVELAYVAYGATGITQQIWKHGDGIYFSDNEVLHLGMIGWLAYVLTSLRRHLGDGHQGQPTAPSPAVEGDKPLARGR